MNRYILALSLSTVFALGACSNQTTPDNNLAAADDLNMMAGNDALAATDMNAAANVDADFVTSSIKGDTAEVAIGQLAASKGSSDGVRDLGNMLVTDHGAHKQQLIDLATSAGIPVPTEPAEAGAANLEKLKGLSGAEFDQTFVQMMIDSHHKGIAKNEAEAQETGPAAQLAQQTLPVLKKHLATAESLAK
jgi:putative membrane protein